MVPEPAPDPLASALAWRRAGERVAVATVIGTWGSAPRQPGSRLFANGKGEFVGSVSGGCVEGAVLEEAADLLGGGDARGLEYGVTDERAWEVGLSCGGRLRVWLEPMPVIYEEVAAARREPRSFALATALDAGGGHRMLEADAAGDDAVGATVREVLRLDRATIVAEGEREWFVEPFNRPPRLVLIGAVHISEALARMAAMVGFEVVVVEPRRRFAEQASFAAVETRVGWPREELAELGIDPRTAIVSLTHDPKLDDPALAASLASPAFYIGALGSRKTMAARLERLRAAGFGDDELARICGPVGLDIGARTPAEIALSIIAQVVSALRGKGVGR